MYTISKDQIEKFKSEAMKQLQNGDNSDIAFTCVQHPSKEECKIIAKFHSISGINTVLFDIFGQSGITLDRVVILTVDWTSPNDLAKLFDDIKNFGIDMENKEYRAACSIIKPSTTFVNVSISESKTGDIVINAEDDSNINIRDINKPADIVNAFNILSKRAIDIGFPIVYDTLTIKTPLELYYHEDYDCILVDKSVIRDARVNLTEDDIAKLKEYDDNLKWKQPNIEDHNDTVTD